jgi:hypothetical protein
MWKKYEKKEVISGKSRQIPESLGQQVFSSECTMKSKLTFQVVLEIEHFVSMNYI